MVTAWVARVIANGGSAPSNNSINAVNTFWSAVKAAGISSKMIHVNCIAPDSYIAATTPLIVGPGGNNQWVDVAGNLQGQQLNLAKGLNGDQSYTLGSMFDTGVIPSATSIGNLNQGISVYVSVQEPDGTNHTHGGCDDVNAGGSDQWKLIYDFNNVAYDTNNPPNGFAFATSNGSFPGGFQPFAGFISCSSEPAGPSWSIGAYGKTAGVYSFPTFTNVTIQGGGGFTPTQNPPHTNSFCWLDCNGQFKEPSAETLSFAAFHQGLTFSQSTALFNAVQALRQAGFGTGYV